MTGPPPKPTVVKEAAGNPGKRPLNQQEPQFNIAVAPAPDWLDEIARECWAYLAPRFARARTLSEVDLDLLAAACERWSTYRQIRKAVGTSWTVDTRANGETANPLLGQAQAALKDYRAIMAEFGVGAGSRSRVKVPERPAKQDPMDRLRSASNRGSA